MALVNSVHNIGIFVQQGLSKRDKLHRRLSRLFNTSLDNVDVFSVMSKGSMFEQFLDVRVSAHGSPYYLPEKINYMISTHMDEVRK